MRRRRSLAPPGPQRRDPGDTLLPLIDVTFFLLVFFMVVARLVAPEPFAVTPAQSASQAEVTGEFTLFVDAAGTPGYRDARDGAALTALAVARQGYCQTADCSATPPHLAIRADAALPAARLAALLGQLGGIGFARVELVTLPAPSGGRE